MKQLLVFKDVTLQYQPSSALQELLLNNWQMGWTFIGLTEVFYYSRMLHWFETIVS